MTDTLNFIDVRCPEVGCRKLIGGMSVGSGQSRFFCRHCRREVYATRPQAKIEIVRTKKKRKSAQRLTNRRKTHILSVKSEIII